MKSIILTIKLTSLESNDKFYPKQFLRAHLSSLLLLPLLRGSSRVSEGSRSISFEAFTILNKTIRITILINIHSNNYQPRSSFCLSALFMSTTICQMK